MLYKYIKLLGIFNFSVYIYTHTHILKYKIPIAFIYGSQVQFFAVYLFVKNDESNLLNFLPPHKFKVHPLF